MHVTVHFSLALIVQAHLSCHSTDVLRSHQLGIFELPQLLSSRVRCRLILFFRVLDTQSKRKQMSLWRAHFLLLWARNWGCDVNLWKEKLVHILLKKYLFNLNDSMVLPQLISDKPNENLQKLEAKWDRFYACTVYLSSWQSLLETSASAGRICTACLQHAVSTKAWWILDRN